MKLRLLNQVLLVTFLFIGSLFTVMLFWGSQRVGATADEYIHMLDLGDWRWTSDPTSERHFGVYGLSFQLLGHGLAVLLGIDEIGTVTYTAESFAARHFVIAMLTLSCAVVVAFIVGVMIKSRGWAVWSGVALLAIPTFLGHGFFNPKDIPTALGYTLFTFGTILTLKYLVSKDTPRFYPATTFLIVAFGIWLAAGTRLGMTFPFGLTFFVAICVALVLKRLVFRDRKSRSPILAWYCLGFIAGLISIGLTNPCLVAPHQAAEGSDIPTCRTGIELLPRIFGISSDYVWSGSTFIAGTQVASQDPSFWLLPLALVVGVPVLILGLSVFGATFAWENLRSFEAKSDEKINPARSKWLLASMGLFVILQAVLVPVAAIMLRATIYDLQRQFLFVYPAVAILAGLGLALVFQLSSNRRDPTERAPFGAFIVSILSIVAIAFPLYEGSRLWPYNYVYVNPLASLGGYSTLWETDYWHAGYREAMSLVPKDQQFHVAGGYWLLTPDVLRERNEGHFRTTDPSGFYAIRGHRAGFGWTSHIEGCRQFSEVSRELRGHVVPIAYVSKCPWSVAQESFWESGLHPFGFIVRGP